MVRKNLRHSRMSFGEGRATTWETGSYKFIENTISMSERQVEYEVPAKQQKRIICLFSGNLSSKKIQSNKKNNRNTTFTLQMTDDLKTILFFLFLISNLCFRIPI